MQEPYLSSARDLTPEVNDLLACHDLRPGVIEDDGHPDPAIALALSGGGFRATLSALGVLRFLADVDLLRRVQVSSSVSGGSIANGFFASRWRALEHEDFAASAFEALVVAPLVGRISRHSLQLSLYLNSWRVLAPGRSFTDVLVRQLDSWLYGGISLDAIPGPEECRFIFNASDIRTGRRYAFRQQDMGEWEESRRHSNAGVRLAEAVAASCSVPGVFPPLRIKVPPGTDRPILLDGGVYDTLGVDPIDHPDSKGMIVSMNAGDIYHSTSLSRIFPRVTAFLKSSQMSHTQNTSQRMLIMGERFNTWQRWRDDEAERRAAPSWARRGVQFSLNTRFDQPPQTWVSVHPEVPTWAGDKSEQGGWVSWVADTPTSLERFKIDRCESLVYRSWWLTGATLARWHPDVLPPERYPVWRSVSL